MQAAHVLDVLNSSTQGPARVFISSEPTQQQRPSSARSEGTASLSRRSRVRRRPSSSQKDDGDSSSDVLSSAADLSSGQLFVKIPSVDQRPSSSPQSGGTFEAQPGVPPPRPVRSPKRLQPPAAYVDVDVEAKVNTEEVVRPRSRTRSTDGREERGRETLSEAGHSTRFNKRGLSLPRYAFRSGSLSDSSEQPSPLTPNAFTDIPPMPAFARNRPFHHHPRDSNATQQSTASSSLYPKSTSTESSLPSPVSLSMRDHDMDDQFIIADPDDEAHAHLGELEGLNQGDVSYRLRLLMQNNYYLPPAHSKPFKDAMSADAARRTGPKSNSPAALLDLLKGVGKKRTVSPPDQRGAPPAITAPMLRATNDSSTMSGLLRPANVQSSTDLSAQVRPRDESKKGRVVVVREQMFDLERIARQVEQELKIREAERHRQAGTDSDSHSDKGQKDVFIDPTDFVDLPMLPADAHTLFGAKAADLSRMPVDAFVNAALLADQLPPASPGWSNSGDDSGERDRTDSDALWRKAVLLAAVNHSLNNTPSNTPSRSRAGSGNHLSTDLPTPPHPVSPSPNHLSPLSPTPMSRTLASAPESVLKEVTVDSTTTIQDGQSKPTLGVSISKNSPDMTKRQRIIGQRIISQLMDENDLCDVPAVPPKDKVFVAPKPIKQSSPAFQAKKKSGVVDLQPTEPLRANSPTVTATPLLPPPRHRKTGSVAGQSADSHATSSDKTVKEAERSGTEASQLQAQEVEIQGRLSDAYERNTGTSRSVGESTAAVSVSLTGGHLTVLKKDSSASFTRTEASSSGSHYSDEDSGDEGYHFHTPREYPASAVFSGSRPSLASSHVESYGEQLKFADAIADVFAADLNESVYLDSSRRSDSIADTLGGRSRSLSIANTLGPRSRTTSRASTVERSETPRKPVISPPPRTSSALAIQKTPLRPTSPVRRTVTSPLPSRPSIASVDDFVPGSFYDEPETPKASGSSPKVRALTLTVPRLTVNVQGGSALDPTSPTAFFDAFEAQSHEEDVVDEEEEEEGDEDEDEAQDGDTLQPLSPMSPRSFEGRRSDVSSDLVSLDPRTGSMHSVAYPHHRAHLAPFMQQRNASSPQLSHDYLLSPSDSASMTGSVKSGRSFTGRGFWGMRLGKSKPVDMLGGAGSSGPSIPRASVSSVDRVQKERYMHLPIENLRNVRSSLSDAIGKDDAGSTVGGAGRSSSSVVNVPVGTNMALDGLLERHMQREKEVLRKIATSHTSKSGSSK